MRSTGSGSMITPVENGSTCVGLAAEQRRPPHSQTCARVAMPVLAGAGIGVAGIDHQRADRRSVECSRQTITGAAQKRFWVKTPATRGAAREAMTSRSLRLGLA